MPLKILAGMFVAHEKLIPKAKKKKEEYLRYF